MNKRAIELSINFIVLFILAMAMFAAGVMIAQRIFRDANEMQKTLTEQQKKEFLAIIGSSPNPVKGFLVTKEANPGDYDLFALGIRNDLGHPTDFWIEEKFDFASAPDNTLICDGDTGLCTDYEWVDLVDGPGSFNVNTNNQVVKELYFSVPDDAPKGTYTYKVSVWYNDGVDKQYDTTVKFKIIVE